MNGSKTSLKKTDVFVTVCRTVNVAAQPITGFLTSLIEIEFDSLFGTL